ncbi:MAG: NAD-dependent epimerase/dehydratase family protein [Cytophagales bacterium]|mgnify:CR=1 FL=1|nr:NAD-dependent epimerase/dehydratase family protein [Cytophagales bacterium]
MIAITGASGLIGTHLVERLVNEGVPVVALVRNVSSHFPPGVTVRQADLLDPLSMETALEGVSTVIHAAALVSFNPHRAKSIAEVNVDGTRHLVNICLRLGILNFIHVSSVAALGRKPGEPVTEEHPWTGLSTTDYARSKYLAELEVYRGAEEGLTVSIINPSVVLSASQLHRSSAVLFDYVWKERRFYTQGHLNYVDVRDVADAVYKLYVQPRPGQKFILSAGSIPYLDFFQRVADKLKKRPPSIEVPTSLVSVFGWLEEVRSLVLNREPLVTRQTAAMAASSFVYDHRKATEILGIHFRPIDESISWCCERYLENVTRTNDKGNL